MDENIVSEIKSNRRPVQIGDRFDFLVVEDRVNRNISYQCIICGSTGSVDVADFLKGHRSARGRCCTHGQEKIRELPEYDIWKAIKQRCLNPNNKSYHNYGGRGIAMHPKWADSFHEFILGIGRRPSEDLTLDRINNNGNYEPGNVRWATRSEQGYNTRRTRFITYKGETKPLKEWAKLAGTDSGHLIYHLRIRSEEETLRWFGL